MIKVGILGAATRAAGEVFRILTHHPDVELKCAYEPGMTGRTLCSVHHGLVGECSLVFTESVSLGKLDVVIVCEPSELADSIVLHPELNPELRVIDLTGVYRRRREANLCYGLSEVNRKELVRGATRAFVPPPVETLALIALYPFANSLMLNADIDVEASGNVDSSDNAECVGSDIAAFLGRVQQSFGSWVNVSAVASRAEESMGRGMRVRITFPCGLNVADAARLYDEIYDDHNFTFLLDHPAPFKEVEGTNKCLINISKPDAGTVCLDIAADSTLSGGAGDAVHLLNLLFGLHELTGLMLKAVCY